MMELKDVSVQFSCGVKALDGVSLAVPEGKNTVVIGESGSGKSVMLSAILRILPPTAHVSGSIELDGTDLLKLTEKQMHALRGARLSYIPQGGGTGMNPLLTVGYQVAEPLMETKKTPKKEAFSQAVEWMRRLQLGREEELSRAYPHTLSGGMRQRAMIAMGTIAGAPLLLADEPTKGLDEKRVETVTKLFRSLEGRTLLCVSHDLHFARDIADYVCVMYASKVMEYGPCADFFEKPLHPYSRMTLEALPENGLKAHMGFAPPQEGKRRTGCRFCSRCPHAGERCREQAPPLVETGGRKVRCWLYAD